MSNNVGVLFGSDPSSSSGGLSTPTSEIFIYGGNATPFGSTNTTVRRFLSSPTLNQGTDITYADSAANGGSFTINTTGVYCVSYTDTCASLGDFFGLTKNGTALTTSIQSTTIAQGQLGNVTFPPVASLADNICITINCSSGDIIRAGGSGTSGNYGTTPTAIRITRIL